MRKRISRALIAATAAGASLSVVGFFAAGPALASAKFGVSGGTPIATDSNCTQSSPPVPSDNCGESGYMASGRDFRFAQALINIPDHTGSSTADPNLYVALDNSGTNTWQYTRVGIAPCTGTSTSATVGPYVVPGVTFYTANGSASYTCPTSGWVAYAATADASGATVSAHAISTAAMGDGVLVNAYLAPTGNGVHTVISIPSTSTTWNDSFTVSGPAYTDAQAVADWTTTKESGGTGALPAAPTTKTRDAQFFQGRFTTVSGTAGTFTDGKAWTVNALEATSNGDLPPSGTLIAQPSYLWTDGSSYQGKFGDAFGVWRYPF